MTPSNAPTDAPFCAPPDPDPRTPRLTLPPLSCDTHAHVCGPESAYPYDPNRVYTPPDALFPDYLKMLATIGVERAVLVQPSVYGADNAAMIAAMAEMSLPCRGVAVIDETASDAEIGRLHEAGVRGIRFNLVDVREPSGAIPLTGIEHLARRVAPLGWHTEFLVHVDDHPNFDEMFAAFPTDIVIGHLGYPRPPVDLEAPGYQAFLRLFGKGRCWVKLTGPYRISSGEMPYADVTPVARALLEIMPDRVIWGSDWPHVTVKKTMPNDGDLVDLLADWVPDSALRTRVLVDNPARLYDFTAS